MKSEKDIIYQLELNKNKIFPKSAEDYKEGYLHALEWVLEN